MFLNETCESLLCSKAINPIREDLISKLEIDKNEIKVAAVCVYHSLIDEARKKLVNSRIPVAAVSAGFPSGLSPMETRLNEILLSILYTVFGIGMVISGYSDTIEYNIVKVNFIPMPSSIYGGFKVFLGISMLIHSLLYLQFIGLITASIGFVFLYIKLIRKK